jgi:hypothetical protein
VFLRVPSEPRFRFKATADADGVARFTNLGVAGGLVPAAEVADGSWQASGLPPLWSVAPGINRWTIQFQPVWVAAARVLGADIVHLRTSPISGFHSAMVSPQQAGLGGREPSGSDGKLVWECFVAREGQRAAPAPMTLVVWDRDKGMHKVEVPCLRLSDFAAPMLVDAADWGREAGVTGLRFSVTDKVGRPLPADGWFLRRNDGSVGLIAPNGGVNRVPSDKKCKLVNEEGLLTWRRKPGIVMEPVGGRLVPSDIHVELPVRMALVRLKVEVNGGPLPDGVHHWRVATRFGNPDQGEWSAGADGFRIMSASDEWVGWLPVGQITMDLTGADLPGPMRAVVEVLPSEEEQSVGARFVPAVVDARPGK